MNSYRLYMMDRGHIRAAKDLTAPSDEEAVVLAEDLREGKPAELWDRARRIAIFETAHEHSA